MNPNDPIVYLNGQYLPKPDAAISVDERGMLFGDGVYEVLRIYAGRPLALGLHLTRMRLSLERIRIAPPADFDAFADILDALLDQNHLVDARVYWQITRGAAPRHPMFPKDVLPTVLVVVSPAKPLDPGAPVPTVTATLMPDERWHNCWVKSLMLLPNVLASNAAHDAGFDSAILHRDGTVTETTNANTMIVRAGELWTHPADRWILNGVTRQIVLQLARKLGLTVRERTFTTAELLEADEVMLTGTTTNVTAITEVDRRPIGEGKPGPVTLRLHQALIQYIQNDCLGS